MQFEKLTQADFLRQQLPILAIVCVAFVIFKFQPTDVCHFFIASTWRTIDAFFLKSLALNLVRTLNARLATVYI